MNAYILIALGSALGGILRHWMTIAMAARFTNAFPWGTFVINVAGSLLIGTIAAFPEERLQTNARMFLSTGVMGGFTTFSAFSLQTLSLLQSGNTGLSLAYALASVTLCVSGCALGWWIGRQIA